MVMVVSPTNSQASTSSTIRRLAPSPRDAPSLKWPPSSPPSSSQPQQQQPSSSSRSFGTRGGGGYAGRPLSPSSSVGGALSPRGGGRATGGSPGIVDATRPPRNPTTTGATTTTSSTSSSMPPPLLSAPVAHDGPATTTTTTTTSAAYRMTSSALAASSEADPTSCGDPPTLPPPPPLLPAAPPPSPHGTTTSRSKSKRMVVIDPRSGKKYDLRADDHSLTNKELHVYGSGGPPVAPPPLVPVSAWSASAAVRDMDSQTLDTASALTDPDYHYLGGGADGNCGGGGGGLGALLRCGSTLGDIAGMVLSGGNGDDGDIIRDEAVAAMLLDGGGIIAEEGRDDVECSERDGKTPPGAAGTGNDDGDGYDPISKALSVAAMVSPLAMLSGLAKKFSFADAAAADDGNAPAHFSRHEPRYRRLTVVVFPEEVRSCLEGTSDRGRGVGLLGMKFRQCGDDFQAHVRWIQRGSKAEKMGVRVGDIVSFAVALSNMTEEQNSFLAEKLIKRLEAVGMRTSYRELYDIFLSKTTNNRPVGLVFRRYAHRGGGAGAPCETTAPASPRTAGAIFITNEFEWSTDFLQSLSIKCREYEFDQKVPFGKVVDLEEEGSMGHKLVSFLPPPNVDTSPSNLIVSDYLNDVLDSWKIGYNCSKSSSMISCIDSAFGGGSGASHAAANSDFLSNRILCSLLEQSMGLVFLRRKQNEDKATTGSGFAVVRKAEGSWSAPCFLSILGSQDGHVDGTDASRPSQPDVKMIVIRNTAMVVGLISGNAVKFSVRKDERANVLVRDAAVIGLQDGRFQLSSDFFVAVKANEVQNQGAYTLSTDHIEASDILTGTVSPPEQSVDFYGALQSLELPYSMHSHPVMPDTLQRCSDSDWVEFLPDLASAASSCGMRTKLEIIARRDSSADVQREIDIFARKFKYYLMDGVPVLRVLSANCPGSAEEKVLRLTIKDPRSLFSSSLELLRRRRPGVSNVGIPSNFSTTFEAITKLSRTPPASLSSLDKEEKRRFFSIETDLSPGPIMMLAKSKKDATLLLCGLKLLLEREKMVSDNL